MPRPTAACGHAEHLRPTLLPIGGRDLLERRDPVNRYVRPLGAGFAPRKLDEITADVRRRVEEDSAWSESSPADAERAAYTSSTRGRSAVFRPKFRRVE